MVMVFLHSKAHSQTQGKFITLTELSFLKVLWISKYIGNAGSGNWSKEKKYGVYVKEGVCV